MKDVILLSTAILEVVVLDKRPLETCKYRKLVVLIQSEKNDTHHNIEKTDGLLTIIGERAKRVRHCQGCTNSSWCGIYMCICMEVRMP